MESAWACERRSGASEPEYAGMGDRLRQARRARGLSLRRLAEVVGVSPSLISQVETGRAKPSVNTLYALANGARRLARRPAVHGHPAAGRRRRGDDALGSRPRTSLCRTIPCSAPPRDRRSGSVPGVVWERLTTESIRNVDFLHVTYEVGGESSPADAFQRHTGQEWGYVLSGTLTVRIGFDEYVLQPGRRDQLRLGRRRTGCSTPVTCRRRRSGSSRAADRWTSPGAEPAPPRSSADQRLATAVAIRLDNVFTGFAHSRSSWRATRGGGHMRAGQDSGRASSGSAGLVGGGGPRGWPPAAAARRPRRRAPTAPPARPPGREPASRGQPVRGASTTSRSSSPTSRSRSRTATTRRCSRPPRPPPRPATPS